jgi:hypothetical protein
MWWVSQNEQFDVVGVKNEHLDVAIDVFGDFPAENTKCTPCMMVLADHTFITVI